jgi:O-antigen ligase
MKKEKSYYRDSRGFVDTMVWILLGLCTAIVYIAIEPASAYTILGGLVLLKVVVKKPEVGILCIVVLISSIVFEESLPLLPIGIGSLHITDVLIIFYFFLLFIKASSDSSFTMVRSPLNLPLALFISYGFFSAFISIYLYGSDATDIVRMLRPVCYYSIFFVVTNLIREKKQIIFVVRGMFTVATIVALVMLVQARLGDAIKLIPGRVERSSTFNEEFETLRLLPPGQTLLYVFLIVAICIYAMNVKEHLLKFKYLLSIVTLATGVMLTYNRTYWVAIMLSSFILFLVMNKECKKRLVALFTILVLLVGALKIVTSDNEQFQETTSAIVSRFTSLLTGNELQESSSVKARTIENQYALQHIIEHPLIGIGLGTVYRPRVFVPEDEITYYVHNGFVWLLLDTGGIGFLLFFWFYLGFIIRCFRNWHSVADDSLRHLVMAFMLSGIGILPMTLYNPIFMQWFSIVVIAIMSGLSESIFQAQQHGYFDEASYTAGEPAPTAGS